MVTRCLFTCVFQLVCFFFLFSLPHCVFQREPSYILYTRDNEIGNSQGANRDKYTQKDNRSKDIKITETTFSYLPFLTILHFSTKATALPFPFLLDESDTQIVRNKVHNEGYGCWKRAFVIFF